MNMSIKSFGTNPLGGITAPVASLPTQAGGHGPEALLKELESVLHPDHGQQGGADGGAPPQGGHQGLFKEALGGLSKLTMPIPGLSSVLKGAADAKGGPLGMLEGGFKGGLHVAEGAAKGALGAVLTGKENPLLIAGGALKGAYQGSDSTPEGLKGALDKLPI